MSARQNKKRKGRNNVNNRERTVTTFTEDPNTSFLVPLPSEEPAGTNLMSSPFSVASSSANNNSNNNNVSFQIPANFGMSYNYMATMHGPNTQQQQQQQQQQLFPPQVMLPPGKNDLEVLENLKNIIKSGQHQYYRPIPQPLALASLYLGPHSHPEQQEFHSYDNEDSNRQSDKDSSWKSTIQIIPNVCLTPNFLVNKFIYLFRIETLPLSLVHRKSIPLP